ESGEDHSNYYYQTDFAIGSDGTWHITGGTANGSNSGSTSYTYEGAGTYSYALPGGGIGVWFVPVQGTTVSAGTVTGTTQASGGSSTAYSYTWSATEDVNG